MLRITRMQLGLAVVFAVGMIAAQAAFALPEYFVEKIMINKAVPIESSSVTAAVLKSKIGMATIRIRCTTNTLSEGKLEKSGESTGKLSFTGCTIVQLVNGDPVALNCGVTNFSFRVDDRLTLPLGASAVLDNFTPAGGATFVEVMLTGVGCTLAGAYKLEGSDLATFDEFISEERMYHDFLFNPLGSSLRFGNGTVGRAGADLYFAINRAELEGKKEWYAV
jgi:hypothetical protein